MDGKELLRGAKASLSGVSAVLAPRRMRPRRRRAGRLRRSKWHSCEGGGRGGGRRRCSKIEEVAMEDGEVMAWLLATIPE